MPPYAHVAGELHPLDEAVVPVADRGFLYGDAVFETIRVYAGVPLAWEEHMDRMSESCAILGMEHDITDAELRQRLQDTLQQNGFDDAYARISITRGQQPGRLSPAPTVDPTVVIIVEELPRGGRHGEPSWDAPAAVAIAQTERVQNAAIPARAKTHNYLNGILARLDVGADVDEAVMLDADGAVTEGTTSNIFVVVDGIVRTPNTDVRPVLPGITRDYVLDLAATTDMDVQETVLYPRDVLAADEVFLTNSISEIRPVVSVDGESFAVGDTTEQLIAAYDRLVEERCYD